MNEQEKLEFDNYWFETRKRIAIDGATSYIMRTTGRCPKWQRMAFELKQHVARKKLIKLGDICPPPMV